MFFLVGGGDFTLQKVQYHHQSALQQYSKTVKCRKTDNSNNQLKMEKFCFYKWRHQGAALHILNLSSPLFVQYCARLYCTVLYCTVLYCTVLYCTVLYCTVLYCAGLYCTVLCWAGQLYYVQYCTVLYYTVLLPNILYCRLAGGVGGGFVINYGPTWLMSLTCSGVHLPNLCLQTYRDHTLRQN